MRVGRGMAGSAVGTALALAVAVCCPAAASSLPWGRPTLVDPPGGRLSVVSCAPDGFCAAADDFGEIITRVGGVWGAIERVGLRTPTAISCGSSTLCVEIGPANRALVFDGSDWRAPSRRIAPTDLVAISCTGSDFCVAVTSRTAMTFDGDSWTRPVRIDDRTHALTTVSCASSTQCVAGDDRGRAVEFDGTSWSPPRQTSLLDFRQLSCGIVDFCVAIDGLRDAAVFDGSLWRTLRQPPVAGALACVSATFCAIAEATWATTLDGTRWRAATTIDPGGFIAGVSCASAHDCVAVDDTVGVVLTFDGSGWGDPQAIDPPRGDFPAMSCPSRTFCAAIDYYGYVVTYDGSTWSDPAPIASSGWSAEEPSLTCLSSSFCVAGSYGGGKVFVYDGHSWTAAQTGLQSVGAISCASTHFCVAAGSSPEVAGAVSTFDGTTWSTEVVDASAVALSAVSCTTASFCQALGYGHNVTTAIEWDGSSWSAPEVVIGFGQIFVMAVACPQTTFCLAITESRESLVFDGEQWGTPQPMKGRDKPYGLACPSPTFCVAAQGGSVSTFDGAAWSDPQVIDHADPPEFSDYVLTTMSCPTTTWCATEDYLGRVFTKANP